MIYEMRTYDLKPRSLPKVLERWTATIEYRKTLSPLAAFWYTEIGPLNQIIHVWPYKDLEERNRIRAEAVASGKWPPKASEHIVNMRSDIMMPWPGSPALPSGKHGPYFEMRTYTMSPGDQPRVQAAWNKVLAARAGLLDEDHGLRTASSVTREHPRAALLVEEQRRVGLRRPGLHAGRTDRHARHRKSLRLLRPLGEQALDVGCRYMALDRVAADGGRVAGRQFGPHAEFLLDRVEVGDVVRLDLEAV